MEPLQQIIKKEEESFVITNLPQRQARFRCSLYADDVALFMAPSQNDLQALKKILSLFAQISGLHTNLTKTEIFPISCSGIDVEGLLPSFTGSLKSFPCKYLSLPLHFKKIRKLDLQPLIDKVGGGVIFQGGKDVSSQLQAARSWWNKLSQPCQFTTYLSFLLTNGFTKELTALDGIFCGKGKIRKCFRGL